MSSNRKAKRCGAGDQSHELRYLSARVLMGRFRHNKSECTSKEGTVLSLTKFECCYKALKDFFFLLHYFVRQTYDQSRFWLIYLYVFTGILGGIYGPELKHVHHLNLWMNLHLSRWSPQWKHTFDTSVETSGAIATTVFLDFTHNFFLKLISTLRYWPDIMFVIQVKVFPPLLNVYIS